MTWHMAINAFRRDLLLHHDRPHHLERFLTAWSPMLSVKVGPAISQAFGVLPALHNTAATGPVIREAQRHLAQWTLEPIAKLISEEASAKLGGAVQIDVVRPLQAYDAGGKARAFSAMIKTLAEAQAAGIDPEPVLHMLDHQ